MSTKNALWYINNAVGVPRIALRVTKGLVHAHYPEYAQITWTSANHYSGIRDRSDPIQSI